MPARDMSLACWRRGIEQPRLLAYRSDDAEHSKWMSHAKLRRAGAALTKFVVFLATLAAIWALSACVEYVGMTALGWGGGGHVASPPEGFLASLLNRKNGFMGWLSRREGFADWISRREGDAGWLGKRRA